MFKQWDDVTYKRTIPVVKTLKSKKLEQVLVRVGDPLAQGKMYMLTIDFYAPLREQLRGFYKSFHVTPQGERKYIATSHFEPTGARLAFPCFDEPSLKATFKVRGQAKIIIQVWDGKKDLIITLSSIEN